MHSLKGHLPEYLKVTKPLLETSRRGYLAAISASSYSYVSLLQHFLPIMNPGNPYLAFFRGTQQGTPLLWLSPHFVTHTHVPQHLVDTDFFFLELFRKFVMTYESLHPFVNNGSFQTFQVVPASL
jgi:hypothetical protein